MAATNGPLDPIWLSSSSVDSDSNLSDSSNENVYEQVQSSFATDDRDLTRAVANVLDMFPDICRRYIRDVVCDLSVGLPKGQVRSAEEIIGHLLDAGTYPKQKVLRTNSKGLKRKRENEGDKEATDTFEHAKSGHNNRSAGYLNAAFAALQIAFPTAPSTTIREHLIKHREYYNTFFAISDVEESFHDTGEGRREGIKARSRCVLAPEQALNNLHIPQGDRSDLEREIAAATRRRQQQDEERQKEAQARELREERDRQHRMKGEVLDCACCFDEATVSNITHCNGDVPHFFCLDCARRNAETDIGNSKYSLRCMDGSGCQSTFSREQRLRFLDDKTIEKIDDLQQRDELRVAELVDFVACPFCDYGHICPPVEVDKEFRCQMPDCQEVSCRLCKERSHVPLSCIEHKKENRLCQRRTIEEARSEALIRTCQKCQLRIMKTDGCNKVVCTGCRSVICDYCGKDISKEKYEHFDGEARMRQEKKATCPLYDLSPLRKDKQVEEAGQIAMEQVRKDNPTLSEEDLKFKFSDEVIAKKHRDGRYAATVARARAARADVVAPQAVVAPRIVQNVENVRQRRVQQPEQPRLPLEQVPNFRDINNEQRNRLRELQEQQAAFLQELQQDRGLPAEARQPLVKLLEERRTQQQQDIAQPPNTIAAQSSAASTTVSLSNGQTQAPWPIANGQHAAYQWQHPYNGAAAAAAAAANPYPYPYWPAPYPGYPPPQQAITYPYQPYQYPAGVYQPPYTAFAPAPAQPPPASVMRPVVPARRSPPKP